MRIIRGDGDNFKNEYAYYSTDLSKDNPSNYYRIDLTKGLVISMVVLLKDLIQLNKSEIRNLLPSLFRYIIYRV